MRVGEEMGGSADQPTEANSDHSQKQEVPTGRAGSRVAPAHKEKSVTKYLHTGLGTSYTVMIMI